MIGIYKITSPTGRVYIGQSVNIEKRFKQYKNMQNVSEQKALFNSFNKHGVLSHLFEIKELCCIDELNKKERFWQEFYNVINTGLNCILTNTKEKKRVFSKETKKLMSISAKNKVFSESHKKNISIAISKIGLSTYGFKGKKHKTCTKLLISKKQKGALNHNFGKKAKKETREKMSKKSSGENNAMFGRKHSKETILKIQLNRSKPLHKKGIVVLNLDNGIFYDSIKKAAFSLNINYITLHARLSGRIKNKTSFIRL